MSPRPVEDFSEARDRLGQVLDWLVSLAGTESRESVLQLAKRLGENRFNVVAVGEFKRGKSTFINALVGARVLPVAAVPLTSVPAAVGYGERPSSRVVFMDEREPSRRGTARGWRSRGGWQGRSCRRCARGLRELTRELHRLEG